MSRCVLGASRDNNIYYPRTRYQNEIDVQTCANMPWRERTWHETNRKRNKGKRRHYFFKTFSVTWKLPIKTYFQYNTKLRCWRRIAGCSRRPSKKNVLCFKTTWPKREIIANSNTRLLGFSWVTGNHVPEKSPFHCLHHIPSPLQGLPRSTLCWKLLTVKRRAREGNPTFQSPASIKQPAFIIWK